MLAAGGCWRQTVIPNGWYVGSVFVTRRLSSKKSAECGGSWGIRRQVAWRLFVTWVVRGHKCRWQAGPERGIVVKQMVHVQICLGTQQSCLTITIVAAEGPCCIVNTCVWVCALREKRRKHMTASVMSNRPHTEAVDYWISLQIPQSHSDALHTAPDIREMVRHFMKQAYFLLRVRWEDSWHTQISLQWIYSDRPAAGEIG